MKVQIVPTYIASISTEIELPEGKTWEDVDQWWIKWNTIHITFNDGTEHDDELDYGTDIIDWKRPANVVVYDNNELIDED